MLVQITHAHARGLRVFNPGQQLEVDEDLGLELVRGGLADRVGGGEPNPVEPKAKAGKRRDSR